jgi:hypothetical protein
MGHRLTERQAAVLTEAAGRPDQRVFNDGRPSYLRSRDSLIGRGYVTAWGDGDRLTEAGRAAVADRIDAAKLAGQAEAAEVAELAHRAELARRLAWRPTSGERVQVIGGGEGMVLFNGPNAGAWDCRKCGRRCLSVDLAIGGGHHYGYAQCEVAPTVDTLAAWLTERADALRNEIEIDPNYPAAARWRVELAALRRLAAEVTGAGPVSEDAGPEVAALATEADRMMGRYIGLCTGAAEVDTTELAGSAALAAYDALRAARGERTTTPAAEAAEAAEAAAGGVPVELAEPADCAYPAGEDAGEHDHAACEDVVAERAERAEVAELARRAQAEGGMMPATLDALARLAESEPAALAALAALAESGEVPCWWTLRCDRPADHLAPHPVLRYVTACQRCRPAEVTAG